nr:MAG TPA: hypothetical protein [Caudoviricetes sp.]
MGLCRSGGHVKVDSDLVICLAGVLWGETLDFLVQRGVSHDEAVAFADKLRWEIEGLLDYVR